MPFRTSPDAQVTKLITQKQKKKSLTKENKMGLRIS